MVQVLRSTGILGFAMAVLLVAGSLACEVDAREMSGSAVSGAKNVSSGAVSTVKDVGGKVLPGDFGACETCITLDEVKKEWERNEPRAEWKYVGKFHDISGKVLRISDYMDRRGE